MDYFVIEVPDMNDSVVKVSLQSRLYQLRFTWNDTGGYWMLGVMDSLGTPLLLGVKMVPQFPLNLLFGRDDMPSGWAGKRPAPFMEIAAMTARARSGSAGAWWSCGRP